MSVPFLYLVYDALSDTIRQACRKVVIISTLQVRLIRNHIPLGRHVTTHSEELDIFVISFGDITLNIQGVYLSGFTKKVMLLRNRREKYIFY